MTQLNELINKHIDSIKFNGCQLSKEMLTLMFDGVVAMAKIQESFEINQRYLDSIGTAFGNGGNDQVNTIGQHITEPEFIQPNEMVKGKWYFISNSTDKCIFKYKYIDSNLIYYFFMKNIEEAFPIYNNDWMPLGDLDIITPATIEEVTKYFSNEFDSNVTEHPNKY